MLRSAHHARFRRPGGYRLVVGAPASAQSACVTELRVRRDYDYLREPRDTPNRRSDGMGFGLVFMRPTQGRAGSCIVWRAQSNAQFDGALRPVPLCGSPAPARAVGVGERLDTSARRRPATRPALFPRKPSTTSTVDFTRRCSERFG
jgi:hypothetical protein